MEEVFDALFPQYNGELAKVMVSDDSRVYGKGGLLDQFTNQDMPRFAISVDMLDTGIDVREIVNLCFAKPVYSYTKFWQMIGRGIRLLEPAKAKPWCLEKQIFLIMDCWDNFEYFKLTPEGKKIDPGLPLPVRLFGIRLDKIETAMHLAREDIAQKEIETLRRQIDHLPASSVVIKKAAVPLNRLAEDNFWIHPDQEKFEFLHAQIKPLFRTVSNTDFKAMRFEKDVLEVSIARLSNDKRLFDVLISGVIIQIGELPLSVHIVKRQQDLIEQAQRESFWADVSDDALDLLVEKLSPLMKFREKDNPFSPIELDLKDKVKQKEFVKFGPQHEAVSITRYKEMVEAKVLALMENNPVLLKIKENKAISDADFQSLVQVLTDVHPHITEVLLKKVYQHPKAGFFSSSAIF